MSEWILVLVFIAGMSGDVTSQTIEMATEEACVSAMTGWAREAGNKAKCINTKTGTVLTLKVGFFTGKLTVNKSSRR